MAKQPAKRGMDLRTVVLVSLVTLMVWLLAESRTVGVQAAEISVRMETGPDSELVVRSAPGFGWPGAVKVNLAGSTAGLGQVLRSLQGVLNLRVGIEIPASAGVHEIDLREVMRTSEVFIEAGVTVSEVTPDRVRVQVDELTVASLPVRAIVPDGVAFESTGAPRPRPAPVAVQHDADVPRQRLGGEVAAERGGVGLVDQVPRRLHTANLLRPAGPGRRPPCGCPGRRRPATYGLVTYGPVS